MAAPARRRASPAGSCDRALAGPARSAIVGDIEEEFVVLRRAAARRSAPPGAGTGARPSCRLPPASGDLMPRSRRASPEPRMSLFRRFDELRDDVDRRAAADAPGAGVHRPGRRHAGPRHRRQQRHLRAGRRHAAAAAAGAPSPIASSCCRSAPPRGSREPRLAAQHDRLARRAPAPSRGWPASRRASARMVMAGATARRRPCRASGSPPGSSTSSACARSSAARSRRPTTSRARPPPSSSARRSGGRASAATPPSSAASSASTASRTPSSASSRATSSSPGGPTSGPILPIARVPEARGEHFLQVVGRLRDGVSIDAGARRPRGASPPAWRASSRPPTPGAASTSSRCTTR